MKKKALYILYVSLPAMLVAAAGCYGPLDAFGVISETRKSLESDLDPEDDRIEDKNPVYDPGLQVTEMFDGCEVTLNKSATVTKLDIEPMVEDDKKYVDKIFSSRAEAIQEAAAGSAELIPSMEAVNGAMKPFNDGLYASIELGVQDGIESIYTGKKLFLQDLLVELLVLLETAQPSHREHIENAAADVAAALILANADPEVPAAVEEKALSAVDAFMNEEIYSKPIGFYTWNETLGRIFMQDRFLQNYQAKNSPDPYSLKEFGKFTAMAAVFKSSQDLLERYESILAIYHGLTNPFAHYPVTALLPYVAGMESLDNVETIKSTFLEDHPYGGRYPWCYATLALFPSSASKETDYYEGLMCSGNLPEGTGFMDLLIRAIKNGEIDLEPDENSGWYDYQTYALETLLLPDRAAESDHLLLTAAYKKKLMDTFRSIMTQNRETHVKQLEIGGAKAAAPPREVDIYPKFPVEPFPTFYLRNARAYRFLETYLVGVLGQDFMEALSRLNEDGSLQEETLLQELHAKAELLYGLYILASDSVGMRPVFLNEEMAEYDTGDCRDRAIEWLQGWKTNTDVLKDPRVIVPVQISEDGCFVHYWAVIGIKVIRVSAEFVKDHKPEVVELEMGCELRDILPHSYYLLVEEFAEVKRAVDLAPPTREEFRQICDSHDTKEAIVNALQGG